MNQDAVMGIGSPHGDDQVGWRVIQCLRQDGDMSATLRAVNDPVDMLVHLRGVRRLLIVDACRSGRPPGTVTRWDGMDCRMLRERNQLAHRLSLADSLQLAKALGHLPRQVGVYGVEIAQWKPETDISPLVKEAIPDLMRRIQEELAVDG